VPLGALDALQNSILEFDPLPPALGLRTMERHMRSGLPPQPEYWEAAQLCNTRLPRRSRLLFLSGIKSYRFDRRCTVPHQAVDPSPFLREYKRAGSPGRLAIRLRQAGFTHVVYLPRVSAVLPDLPELAFREPEAAGIVSWMRRFTAFDFRWGEALVYSLGRNPVPRQLGRVPFLEEYAMKEATGPGSVPVPWAMTALAKLAPESSTNGQVRGIRILMGPPPRPAEALGPLGAATRSEEASSSTWRAYAFALGETGDGMRALACYRQALELLPSDGQAHFGMGIVLARAGRLREAADEIAAAVRIEPGRAEFRQALNQVLAALR
jgi:tetratricopeptide (TPR) repeat protein